MSPTHTTAVVSVRSRSRNCNRPTVTCISSYYFLLSFLPIFPPFVFVYRFTRLSPVLFSSLQSRFLFRNPFPLPSTRPLGQRTALLDQPRCVLSLSPGQRKQTNETNKQHTHRHRHVFYSTVWCVVLTFFSINLVVCCRCHQLVTLSRPQSRFPYTIVVVRSNRN